MAVPAVAGAGRPGIPATAVGHQAGRNGTQPDVGKSGFQGLLGIAGHSHRPHPRQEKCHLHAHAAHRLGQSIACGAEPATDIGWKLPAEHERLDLHRSFLPDRVERSLRTWLTSRVLTHLKHPAPDRCLPMAMGIKTYTIGRNIGLVKSYVIIFHEFSKNVCSQPGVCCLASAGSQEAVPSLRRPARSTMTAAREGEPQFRRCRSYGPDADRDSVPRTVWLHEIQRCDRRPRRRT